MTTETVAKPKSKTEAQKMFDEDTREWRESFYGEAEAYVNDLTNRIVAARAGDDETLKVLMEAVALHVPTEPGLGDMRCITCIDHDYYPMQAEWPCKTFVLLARALDLPGVAEMGEAPKFEDYWTDPFVTVTLAKAARVTLAGEGMSKHLHRGKQITVSLTEAIRLLPQLAETSQRRVEALA